MSEPAVPVAIQQPDPPPTPPTPAGASRGPHDARGQHYSYAHYADARVAAGFDQLRFGGPIGQLVAELQEQAATHSSNLT